MIGIVPIKYQPTDTELLRHAFWQGMEAKNMRLVKWVPMARHYRDEVSGRVVALHRMLPELTPNGELIDSSWHWMGNRWDSGVNLFSASVQGRSVTLTALYNQPWGGKADDTVTWQPQLFLNDTEIKPKFSILLETDPVNPNYHNNVLEWDYGICKRRIRIFEGRFRERWIFQPNPNGDVRIKHNLSGNLPLKLGYAMDADDMPVEVTVVGEEEFVFVDAFAKATYPVEIGASPETFYPDAHEETSSVDGYAYHYDSGGLTWANIIVAAGTAYDDVGTIFYTTRIRCNGNTNEWDILARGICLFDTSGLPDGATITAATLSVYGQAKRDDGSITPDCNVYSSLPASNTVLAGGDFDSLGTTAFCDTAITYAGFSTSGYNDFSLNASGIAAISKTGVSKFGLRNANYDVAESAPEWGSGEESHLKCYSADQANTTNDPKLVVTYEEVGEANIPAIMAHYRRMREA